MNNEESYGFIAISLSTVGKAKLPTLVLEYLFVSLQYRGVGSVGPDLGSPTWRACSWVPC